MSDYSQPAFYRFSEDSLRLVRFVTSRHKSVKSLLDLGAGSGVIGLELAQALAPERVVLVELQREYESHLLLNVERFLQDPLVAELIFEAFSQYSGPPVELIVCNPPYFFAGQGIAASDRSRQLARTFEQDSWPDLLQCIDRNLLPKGQAYLVVRRSEELLNVIHKGLQGLNLQLHVEEDGVLGFLILTRLNVD